MKFNEKNWLEGRMAEWKREKLLTAAQVEAIEVYEADRPGRARFTFLGMLLGLGGLLVAVGIILMVSYNWEEIPPMIRQVGFLLLLVGVAEASSRLQGKPFETPLHIIWLALPLAGIGLWGQIYQLSGDTFKPLMVLAILGLPIVWMGKHAAAAAVHAVIVSYALYIGAHEKLSLISMRGVEGWALAGKLGLCALLWAGLAWQTRRLGGPRLKLIQWLACLVFFGSLVNLRAFGYGDVDHASLLVCGLVALVFALPRLFDTDENGAFNLGFLATALLLYAMTFSAHSKGVPSGNFKTAGLVYAWVFGLAGLAAIITLPLRGLAGAGGHVIHRIVLAAPYFLAFLLMMGLPYKPMGWLANLLLLGLCLYHMHAGVLNSKPKIINLSFFMVGLLLVTRFFDYFGSLLDSGLAFIITGLLLMGLAWGLHRGRKELLDQVGKGGAS